MSNFNINSSSTSYMPLEQEAIKQEPVANQQKTEAIDSATEVSFNNEAVSNELNKAQQAEQAVASNEVNDIVEEMNLSFQAMQRQLSFSVDDNSGEKIILVKDTESDEVIRQIPSEELVVLRKKMDDVVGILFDTKV